MAARALDVTDDIRCLTGGLAALATGLLTFLAVAVLTVLTPAVSGAWLLLPCLVMLTGLAAVIAWLVFGDGARRFDPAPVTAQVWQWAPTSADRDTGSERHRL